MSRSAYEADLEQLKIQVEVMGLRVEENLDRMAHVLRTGDEAVAGLALAADDGVDAMNVSLTDRCTKLLARQSPVASDLRLVLSVIRMLSELERVGDLALRVVRLAPDHQLLQASPVTFDILLVMSDTAVESFARASRAWSASSLELATDLSTGVPQMTHLASRLVAELTHLDQPRAAAIAVRSYAAGQALDRITDHCCVIGSRIRYLLTGDPSHLAAEIR